MRPVQTSGAKTTAPSPVNRLSDRQRYGTFLEAPPVPRQGTGAEDEEACRAVRV